MKVQLINKCKYGKPEHATLGASGLDLRANIDQQLRIWPGESEIISTGIYCKLPEGYEFQVRGRSGLFFKHNLIMQVGTIDEDYTGEIMVKIHNLSKHNNYFVQPGERIAQLVLAKVEKCEWVYVEVLEQTERGTNGFGHTGKL